MSTQIYEEYLFKKSEKKRLEDEMLELETKIYEINQGQSGKRDGFKITIKHNEAVKIDQAVAASRPTLFKVSYDYSATMFKSFNDEEKKFVTSIMTTKPNKPTFKIEREE